MDRTVWIIIAVVALAVAGFFGYRAYQNSSQRETELQNATKLQKDLEESRRQAKEASAKADYEAEAHRLLELKQKQEAEAEARRLAQAQSERDTQEAARKRAEDDKAKAEQEIERIRGEKAKLQAEAQRLEDLRAKEAAEAKAKLEAAQKALAESEQKKNAEIERQAALIAQYNSQPKGPEKAPAKEETSEHRGIRYIYPIDYKRANHTYLPLLPTPESADK